MWTKAQRSVWVNYAPVNSRTLMPRGARRALNFVATSCANAFIGAESGREKPKEGDNAINNAIMQWRDIRPER